MKIINTLENMELSTSNLVESYWELDILNNIYFIPKKVDKRKSYELIRDEEFLRLLETTASFLKKCDVVKVVEELFHEFEDDTKYQLKDEKLYLILGYHTTTIYSAVVNSEEISVLCLESLEGNMDKLKMLLAHEFTHYVRKQLLDCDIFETSIGERIITEGIASNYSREMVPSKTDSFYCIVSEDTVSWVATHTDFIRNYIKDNLCDNILMRDLFYMYADISFPVRCGYVYGYFVVKKYLAENGLQVKDILGIEWKEILKVYEIYFEY